MQSNTAKLLWGVDLGGTKIEGIVLDPQNSKQEIARMRVPTEQELGYQHILQQIKKLIDQLSQQTGHSPAKIGFGTPGVLDPLNNLLKNSNTQCLNGKPLCQDLETLLGVPITLANDANCFALAEHIYGAAKGSQCTFGIIMGTGVGGGLVIGNSARYGLQGIAGEWGHNVLDPQGPACYCGKNGCVETIISGPALEKYYTARAKQTLSLNEIYARRSTDTFAAETIDHLIEKFAQAASVLINILDPDVLVLGGGVSNIDELYSNGLIRMQQYVFNDRLETRVVKNHLGDSAGVYGAALL